MALKNCTRCSTGKPLDQFGRNRTTKDGLQRWCKECLNGYTRQWARDNPEKARAKSNRTRDVRRAVVRKAKAVPCMDCRVQYPSPVMEFDHRPGVVKLFTIGPSAAHVTMAALEAEIAKCDVVCANCHRIRTWTRAGYPLWEEEADGTPAA